MNKKLFKPIKLGKVTMRDPNALGAMSRHKAVGGAHRKPNKRHKAKMADYDADMQEEKELNDFLAACFGNLADVEWEDE